MATPEQDHRVQFNVDSIGGDSDNYDPNAIVFDIADDDIYVGTHPIIETTKEKVQQAIDQSIKYQDYQAAALNRVNEISSQASKYYGAYANRQDPIPLTSHDFGIRIGFGNPNSSRGLQCPLVEPQSFDAGEPLTLQFRYRGNRTSFTYFYLLMVDNNLRYSSMPDLIPDEEWHTYTYSFIVQPSNSTMTNVTSIQICYGRDASEDAYVDIARGSLVLYRSAEDTHWAPAPQDYGGSTSLGRLDVLENKLDEVFDVTDDSIILKKPVVFDFDTYDDDSDDTSS